MKLTQKLEIGKRVPEFSLRTSDGTDHSLRDYAAKTVLVSFLSHAA